MSEPASSSTGSLTQLWRYPVKSLRGQRLTHATVERCGLAGDRRWMIVDAEGGPVTAREHPQLLVTDAQLIDGGLRLTGPHGRLLEVAVPDGSETASVNVRREPFPAALAGEEAHEWLSALIGEPVRLVYLHDPAVRSPNARFSQPADRVAFGDGYPVHLLTEESLTALRGLITARGAEIPSGLPAHQFRPNLVVRGWPAWSEDSWRLLRVGTTRLRVVKGVDRCVLSMTDPATALRDKEPVATLAHHRRWDGAVWFGMYAIPDELESTLTVGDEVEVLAAEDGGDGPPR